LATLEKRGVTLRELRAYIDKDLSTIWRHIAEFEEAGIAIQIKRGKWTLTSPTLTATLANALDRVINEFNIALAYTKAIDEKFGLAVKETLPIWVKLWIKPLAFTTITSDEENPITSSNQAQISKTIPTKARLTNKNTSEKERHYGGCVAGLYLEPLFEEWAIFLFFYLVYDYSFVPFS
jgi:DNA-binding transcriptional ArsR family regulator